jgi:MSHA biogenesis protein MshI
MNLFAKRKKDGWLALAPMPDGVCVARIAHSTSGKPRVAYCEYRRERLENDDDLKALSADLELKKHHCTTLLNSNEYQLLQVEAPKVPAAEIKQAVRWQLKELIDYSVDNATIDVLDIPPAAGNTMRQHYLYVVAARNDVIRSRIERHMERNGAGLEAIDIPEMAQRNIAALLEQQGRGLATLSFGPAGGLLTFTFAGELYHARQIDIGLAQFQTDDSERQAALFERVSLELQRSLDNFERQFPYVSISRLVLAPFPGREAFREFLHSYLYLQVDTFELSDIFDFDQAVRLGDPAMQASLLPALGAALREGKPV